MCAQQLQLGTSDLAVIGHLYQDGPLTPRELGMRMEMTSGTMTALLDRVEKAGFLTRNKNPRDRRSLLITTTPAGQHAMQWVNDHFDTAIREALTAIPDLATDHLDTVLGRLSHALEITTQGADPARNPRPAPLTKKHPPGPHRI